MKDSTILWAKYNLATDEKVRDLLVGVGDAGYTQERNTYYKSLRGLHLHYVQTYTFYMKLIRKNSENRLFVSPLTEDAYEVKAQTIEEVSKAALEYDQLFLSFAETVSEADLHEPKTKRTMRNGKTYFLSVGDIVAQIINHTTHHRGQLSQILDELGIEHDIGGILVYAEELKE